MNCKRLNILTDKLIREYGISREEVNEMLDYRKLPREEKSYERSQVRREYIDKLKDYHNKAE